MATKESPTQQHPSFDCTPIFSAELRVFKTNCPGYFRNSFFTLEEVLQRQADIKNCIKNVEKWEPSNKEKIAEFEQLYLATEHMRVALQQKIAERKKKLGNELYETEIELARVRSKEAYLVAQIEALKEEMASFGKSL